MEVRVPVKFTVQFSPFPAYNQFVSNIKHIMLIQQLLETCIDIMTTIFEVKYSFVSLCKCILIINNYYFTADRCTFNIEAEKIEINYADNCF